jgi:phage-related protein
MSNLAYARGREPGDKPLVWLHGQIKTPPFSEAARIEAGYLLWLLQKGRMLMMPHSRPMPIVGSRCHELRVRDAEADGRIVYRADTDAVVILAVFRKTTRATPKPVIDACVRRLKEYDRA